jgi:NAD(P)-dependent dehydrogenase (short-subunit alcohol dehydrogenase family)
MAEVHKKNQSKTAIITGSGRGIGKEVAVLLAKKKVNVVVCARTQSEIDSTVQEIKEANRYENGAGVIGIKCDVSKSSEIDSLIKSTVEKFTTIDILINNAGIVFVKKLIDTTEQEWDQTININLKSAFLSTKSVLPYMLSNNYGVIINVSSGAGKVGFADISCYCASKFGIMGLTQSLALEVASHNIRVMTICPGEVATKMQQDVDPEYFTLNKNKMLKPQTVAQKIVDMIFDDKRYKNGKSIDIG